MSDREVFLQSSVSRAFSKPEVKFLADKYREIFDFLAETKTKSLLFCEPLEGLVDEMPEVFGTDTEQTAIMFFVTTSTGEATISALKKLFEREGNVKFPDDPIEETYLDLN